MKNTLYTIKTAALSTLMFIPMLTVHAQAPTPKEQAPILFVPGSQHISSNENVIRLNVDANIPFEVRETADWIEIFKKDNKNVYLKIRQNFENEERTATISVSNNEKNISRNFLLTQSKDNSIEEAPDENHPEFDIFADDLYTQLKKEITLKQIENLTNPFIKSLAYKIYKKSYDTKFRVANFECWLNPRTLAHEWKSGQYDQFTGPTGINIPSGEKLAVIVRDIPEKAKVTLRVCCWWRGGGGSEKGPSLASTTFDLHNGINIISNDKYPFDALAYICYYQDKEPITYNDIRVHFVNGDVNGYITQDMTNEAIKEMCGKAKNKMMDMITKKVHAVWTAEGLYKYSNSRDGKLGYRQHMNYLDSIVTWEQRALGLEKYKRIRKNRTMIYTNFGGGVFCGGTGASFDDNNEKTLFNLHTVIDGNHTIWGIAHEWGHQHQIGPYFKWTWMTECTNNVMSYYCCILAGAKQWNNIGYQKYYNALFKDSENLDGKRVSSFRQYIYEHRDLYKWNPKLYSLCEEMKDGKIATLKDNHWRATSYVDKQDIQVGLTAFNRLSDYLWFKGNKDFLPNMYESMRQIDYPQGSQIEKKGFIDKYELLALAQNRNTNNALATYREKYPESCWTKNNYITPQHCQDRDNAVPFIFNYIRKVSRLSGYNLTPWFEKWGFIRQVAFGINDYGYKYYLMTQDMLDEFLTDMDEMVKSGEVKVMPEGMLDEIFYCKNPDVKIPNFPN